jgi:transposase
MEDKILKRVQGEKTIFTDLFKRSVCEEHLRTGVPKDQLKEKYGIKGKSAILNWMRKFGYLQDEKSTTFEQTVKDKEQQQDQASVQAKIKELERALEQAKLEKEAWKTMVEVAERELKINIRKK